MKRYEQLVDDLSRLIRDGTIRPGHRMPSVRGLTRSHSVSPGTVMQAYGILEDLGLIEARPRSGYYVTVATGPSLAPPRTHRPDGWSRPVDVSELVFHILAATKDRSVIPFGSAFPGPELFPFKALAQGFGAAARHLDPWQTVEDLPPGNLDLRRLISHRYLEAGATVSPDEIVITSGALEGLNLCLQTVTRPGDVVAVESPAFYGALQAIEACGLRALEIPTEARTGVDLNALEQALQRHPIKACWFMTTFQNPMGSLTPEADKQALVNLLAHYQVPLIEDDVYAELYLGEDRPRPAKAFDTQGLVMHCSSFSKCLAPGYRVGWAAPGRYMEQVQQRKLTSTLSASIPSQMAIREYLKRGGYERHLRQLRQALAARRHRMLDGIGRYFPASCRLSRPDGGYFLWVELPGTVDTLELHARAMKAGISISPGPMFSAQRGFRHCLRLNYGHHWDERLEQGLKRLGQLVSKAI